MKSRTSSCKAAAFRKDIIRFWPVWALYILFHIFLQVIMCQERRDYWYLATAADSIQTMSVINAVYALAVAVMLFGDLFNARMCSGIHCLPLKREHWFAVHLKSGLLFSLIPTALVAVFMEAVMVEGTIITNGWQIPLYWWVASNLQYLFYFGLAVFCVMCAGSRFGAALVYGGLNCFSILIWLMVDSFYTPLLHGVVTPTSIFKLLCPFYWLSENSLIAMSRDRTGNTYIDAYGITQEEYIGSFTLKSDAWMYLGVLVIVGIVLLILARQMYKKRNLEKAGDFMAVKWLEPVFQVVFTVLCSTAVYGGFYIFFGYYDGVNQYLVAVLGMAAGWFAGRMLLERSTRVFRVKNFAGLALLTLIMAGSLYATKLDPMGIENWMPEAASIEKAELNLGHETVVKVNDPEEIKDFLRIHELALEEKIIVGRDHNDMAIPGQEPEEAVAYIRLTYWLENGLTSEREYYIRPESEAGRITGTYASRLVEVIDQEGIVSSLEDLRHAMKKVTHASLEGEPILKGSLTEEFLLTLVEAINADCEAGHMVQAVAYHPDYLIADEENPAASIHSVYLSLGGTEFWCSVRVFADCENTLAVLESTGVMDAVRQTAAENFG